MVFSAGTIPGMHETTERLYEVAKAVKAIQGQSALAVALSESPQTVNNWETRGVSAVGALNAQKVFGCNANWLLTGEGAVLAGWPFSPALLGKVTGLPADEITLLESAMWIHLRQPIPAEAANDAERLKQLGAGVHKRTPTGKTKRSG